MGNHPHESHRIVLSVLMCIYPLTKYLPLRGPQDRKFEDIPLGFPLVGEDNCGGIGPVFPRPEITVEDVRIEGYRE